ncbi:MAG: hypothetical protein U0326_40695 [Polyangiales bacterium]
MQLRARDVALLLALTPRCSTSARPTPVAPVRVERDAATAPTSADAGPSTRARPAQIPHDYALPTVVRVDAHEALLLAGNLRVIVRDDGVEVSSTLTERSLSWAQQRDDGRWYFLTRDGLALTARSFTGPFEASEPLPRRLMSDELPPDAGTVAAAALRLDDGAWVRLDERARPATIESDYADVATDLRFVGPRRALALVSPNLVGLSDDGGETWTNLDTPGDTPLRFAVDDRGATLIEGARFRWRLNERGDALAKTDARGTDHSAEPALARWGAWWREHLWPDGATLRFDAALGVARAHGDQLIAWRNEGFVALRRDGTRRAVDVTGAPLGYCDLSPFGDELLADCHAEEDAPARLLLLNPAAMTVRELAPPATPSNFAAAPDGSVIVEYGPSLSSTAVGTPASAWRRVELNGFAAVLDGIERGTAFVTARGAAPRVISIGTDGAPTLRALAPTGRGAHDVVMIRSHDGLRTVLTHDAPNHRCGIVLTREGAAYAALELDGCDEPEEALFVDDRVGVIVTRTGVLSTRDGGARWVRQERMCGDRGVRPRTWQRSSHAQIEVTREGMLIAGSHLVPFEGEADARVWRRPELEAAGAAARPDSHPFTLLRCRQTTPVAATPPPPGATALLHHGARVEIRTALDGERVTADLRWRGDAPGVAGSFHAQAPWPEAQLDLSDRARVVYATRGVSAAGVLLERCLLDASRPRDEGATTRCSVHWFHRSGVTDIEMQQPLRSDVGSLVDLAAPDGDGWVVELSPGDAPYEATWSQWQHWSADHRLTRWGDVRRRHATEPYTALARIEGAWGAVVGDMERQGSLRFLPHDPTVDDRDFERPTSVTVCVRGAGASDDIWIDPGGLGVGLFVRGLALASSSNVAWSWTYAWSGEGWCALEGHSALTAHEWTGRARDRSDVAWSVRMGDAVTTRAIPMGELTVIHGVVTGRSGAASARDRSRRVECGQVELGDPLYWDTL